MEDKQSERVQHVQNEDCFGYGQYALCFWMKLGQLSISNITDKKRVTDEEEITFLDAAAVHTAVMCCQRLPPRRKDEALPVWMKKARLIMKGYFVYLVAEVPKVAIPDSDGWWAVDIDDFDNQLTELIESNPSILEE